MKTIMTQLTDIKNKIHWFVLPLLITLLTFLVVSNYTAKEDISIIKTNELNEKGNQEMIMETQQEVLKVARESRQFSMDNNNILTQKADRTDVINIQERLQKIEKKVDQIYSRHSEYFGRNDTTWYFNIYNTEPHKENVWAQK